MAGKPGAKPGVIRKIILKCINCDKDYQAFGKHRREGPHPSYYCSVACRIEHSKRPPALDSLRDVLDYDPETGIFKWLVDRGRVRAGDIAGTIDPNGYRWISIDYKHYPASQLAFLWITSDWTDDEMDHINCIPGDDRWCNLRPATSTQQKQNRRAWKIKIKDAPKGAFWHKRFKRYQSMIKVSDRYIHLGWFDTAEEAHAAYAEAAAKHHGEFARAE